MDRQRFCKHDGCGVLLSHLEWEFCVMHTPELFAEENPAKDYCKGCGLWRELLEPAILDAAGFCIRCGTGEDVLTCDYCQRVIYTSEQTTCNWCGKSVCSRCINDEHDYDSDCHNPDDPNPEE